jgi:hypothetical protein
MNTTFEFSSEAFPPYPDEDEQINPGRFGKRLAEFLQEALPRHGFEVTTIGAEDWGWMVELKNEEFPLWIGCGNVDGSEHEFLCFIEPSKPEVKKLFKKIPTEEVVDRLKDAVEAALSASGTVNDFRWTD